MSKVIITISPDGRHANLKVDGIAGQDCKAISAPYEQGLIATATNVSDTPTREMYQDPAAAKINATT